MKQWIPFAALWALSGFCLGFSILGLISNHEQANQPPSYAFAQVSDTVGQNSVKTYTQEVVIPFHADTRALMIDAKINNHMTMTFVVDTGATYTAISEDMARSLGYDLENSPKINVTTANGRTQFPKIMLKEVNLNGYRVQNVEATVMPLPQNAPFSGLLGLSFIRHHKMTIDPIHGNLVLEPWANNPS